MKNKIKKILTYTAFAVYAAAMVFLLFNRTAMPFRSMNLIPLKTIAQYVDYFSNPYLRSDAVVNIWGNIIMFIPLGFFLSVIWKKLRRFPWHILATAVIITIIELLQYVTLRGAADIDDLILNIVGSTVGLLLYTVYEKIKNHIIKKKSEKQIG